MTAVMEKACEAPVNTDMGGVQQANLVIGEAHCYTPHTRLAFLGTVGRGRH